MENKVIERVKKLLALAESKNSNEAQSALMKAQALIMKHKLDMREIEEYDSSSIKVETKLTDYTFDHKARWKGRLAMMIADNFGCFCYFRTNRTRRIVFLGKDEDVYVCEIMYKYALDSIVSEVKRRRKRINRQGYSAVGLMGDYALGFIDGLEERFEEQKAQHQEWGLVLVKDIKVQEAYDNIKFGKSISLQTKFSGNSDAYYGGKKDGKSFSISDRIEKEGEEPAQLA